MSTLRTDTLRTIDDAKQCGVANVADLTNNIGSNVDGNKGAALVGFNQALTYPAGTVGASLKSTADTVNTNNSAISTLQTLPTLNNNLLRKKKTLEVGFRDSTYDTLIATYSYDFLYPQSFAIDTTANELWVLKGANSGANSWAWIWVYDLTTGTRKTTFSTGQQWRENLTILYIGGVRYIYTIGNSNNVIRFNVAALPADLSTPAVANTYTIGNAQSFMAWDGGHWWVQDALNSRGQTQRNRFRVYDLGFANQVGYYTLPFEMFGTLNAYTQYFPKVQGIAWHMGKMYLATGGAWDPNNATHVTNQAEPYYLQGIQAVSGSGKPCDSALLIPSNFRGNMNTLTGYTTSVCETEGVYSAGGNLYSLQITLGPTDRVNPSFAGKGVVLVQELVSTSDATLFYSTSIPTNRSVRTGFAWDTFQQDMYSSGSQLKNPVTGANLNTFLEIATMMRELDLAKYSFQGTNQTITDINSAAVATTGRLIEFSTANGISFAVKITGASIEDTKYFLSNIGTSPSQVGPIFGDAEYGSNANGEYIKHGNGVMECWYNDAATQATQTLVASTAVANSIYQSAANLTWTYPQAFVAEPEVTLNIRVNTANAQVAWINQRNSGTPTTTAVFRISSPYNTASDVGQWRGRAIGRWK